MKKRGGFKEKLQLAEPAADMLRTGDVLDASEEQRNRIIIGALGGAEDDLVRVVEAEGDGVAVLEFAAIDFFAVDEEAAALAAILDIVAIGFDDHGGAVAGDAAVRELQVVAGFGAAAEHKRRLSDAGVTARAVRGDDFENCFTGTGRSGGHGPRGGAL